MSELTITNALILPMTNKRTTLNGYVRIIDGSIAELGEGSPTEKRQEEEIIDATGYLLMPGLINAHTHLYQVLLRAVWRIFLFCYGSSGFTGQLRFFARTISMPEACWRALSR